jgi:hypothetical protein
MPRLCRRRSQRADRHDDPQPHVGALDVALAPHVIDPLSCFGSGAIAVSLDQQVRGAGDVQIGWWHAHGVADSPV